jgi:LysM repeat protein
MAEQYYRYSPQAITPDQKQGGDGVVVKEIPIQKGDTLYDLSRKYSGKGYYYPQILLFNDIKNPDRIYTGDLVRIPLGVAAADEQQPAAASQNKKHDLPSRKNLVRRHPKKITLKGVQPSFRSLICSGLMARLPRPMRLLHSVPVKNR